MVEAIGSDVTRFKPGDEVYANLLDHGYGGFAEYVWVLGDVMSLKPANLSFEEASAVPMAAVTALQGLRHHGVSIWNLPDRKPSNLKFRLRGSATIRARDACGQW